MLSHVVLTQTKLNYFSAVRTGFLLIFSALLLSNIVDQFLNKKIETIIRSPDGLSPMIWFWGVLALTSALIFPMLLTLVSSYALIPTSTFKNFFSKNFELGLLEVMRSWGKGFLWGFLFILPGLIAYSYYLLTPFVVFYSDNYHQGKVDAIKMSTAIFRKNIKYWFIVNTYFFIFYCCVPIFFSAVLDEYRMIDLHPISATLSFCVESLLILLFHYLVLKDFIKYLKEVEPDAPAIAMASPTLA